LQGYRKGALSLSISLQGFCLGNLGGDLLFLGSRRYGRAQEMDITLLGGPAGEFSKGLVYWVLGKALQIGTFLHKGLVECHGRGHSSGTLRDI
jgi:hypothetical protein